MWHLLIHGQDREQNFVKLCAPGTPNAPCALVSTPLKTHAPAFMNRLLTEGL
jgi:hypothetical protein